MKDCYTLLGISPMAGAVEIEEAYQRKKIEFGADASKQQELDNAYNEAIMAPFALTRPPSPLLIDPSSPLSQLMTPEELASYARKQALHAHSVSAPPNDVPEASIKSVALSVLAMIVMGYFFNWQVQDLVWGIWLSNQFLITVICVAQFIVFPYQMERRNNEFGFGFESAFFAVLVLSTLMIVIGNIVFYLKIFEFLYEAVGMPPIVEAWTIDALSYAEVLMGLYIKFTLAYWPVVLVTLLDHKDLFLSEDNSCSSKADFPLEYIMRESLVLSIALVMIALLSPEQIHDSFWVYAFVCVFYFLLLPILRPYWRNISFAKK